jgi:hypothetical protein
MPPPFFTAQNFDTYAELVKTPYNSEDPTHQSHRDFMVDTLGSKIKYWADQVVSSLPGFTKVYHGNFTNQIGISGVGGRQVIKNYVWAKISTPAGHDAGIYFTVDINGATRCLQYKLDYDYRTDRSPTPEKKQQLEQSHNRTNLAQVITPEQLVNFTWETLIQQTVSFIQDYHELFSTWIEFVNDTTDSIDLPRQSLIKQDPPLIRTEDTAPEYTPSGRSRRIDFEEQQERNTTIGAAGEELVRQYEANLLSAAGYSELALRVRTFETDGEGYDVESFYPEDIERKKYIEVKTTTGPANTPFFLSRNELAQAQNYQPSYSLYRLYNYNETRGTANFYEDPNFGVRDQDYQLVPVAYLVYRR